MSSTVIAMDYSHPEAPSNMTECVEYANNVVSLVEKMQESEIPRDISRERYEENLSEKIVQIAHENGTEDKLNDETLERVVEYLMLTHWDAYNWYKSTQYGVQPEVIYQTAWADCDIGVADQEQKELMEQLEGMRSE
ncbi:hypothetical protein [Halomonas salinarum]|uniref:hypothetical protein n=1 Tax=Halomonas salinarum TaxID=1158993 RepID=UPI00143B219A|nr:hypothetical protein [Halomonas salinarum]